MNPRQKLTYLWDYYKVLIVGIPLALLLILFVVKNLFTDTEPALTVYLVNQPVTEDARAAFEKELCEVLLPPETDGRALVDASLTITPSAPDHESQAAFTTGIAGHTIDIMIGDMEFYSYYARLDAFADLTELLPEELLEALAPHLLQAEGADGALYTCGIDVSGFASLAPLSLDAPILTVAGTSEHTDAVITFLRVFLHVQPSGSVSFYAKKGLPQNVSFFDDNTIL